MTQAEGGRKKRYRDRRTYIQIDRQTGKPIDRQMEILRKEIVTDRQCERVMRKTDRHSERNMQTFRERKMVFYPLPFNSPPPPNYNPN